MSFQFSVFSFQLRAGRREGARPLGRFNLGSAEASRFSCGSLIRALKRTEGRAPWSLAAAFLALCALHTSFCGSAALAAEEPTPPEPADGPALVRLVDAIAPVKDSELRGVLKIEAKGKVRKVPVICRAIIHEGSWEAIYQAFPTNGTVETLTVVRTPGAPNQYTYTVQPAGADTRAPAPGHRLTPAEAAGLAFGGSDFSAADLGLDFLHWPQQKKLPGQMRLGQPCYVLESRDTNAPEIVYVKSWIDKKRGGVLEAEGWDRKNKLIKSFSLSASDFKKIDGQWQVGQLEISNEKTDSITTLKYDLNEVK